MSAHYLYALQINYMFDLCSIITSTASRDVNRSLMSIRHAVMYGSNEGMLLLSILGCLQNVPPCVLEGIQLCATPHVLHPFSLCVQCRANG